jgi:hypothetical protein
LDERQNAQPLDVRFGSGVDGPCCRHTQN